MLGCNSRQHSNFFVFSLYTLACGALSPILMHREHMNMLLIYLSIWNINIKIFVRKLYITINWLQVIVIKNNGEKVNERFIFPNALKVYLVWRHAISLPALKLPFLPSYLNREYNKIQCSLGTPSSIHKKIYLFCLLLHIYSMIRCDECFISCIYDLI